MNARELVALWVVLLSRLVSSQRAQDSYALRQVRNSLESPQALVALGWVDTLSPCGTRDCSESTCNWRGVACHDGAVVGINLTGVVQPGVVSGELDDALGTLEGLTYLVMENQVIHGTLPDALSHLSQLAVLVLRNNKLSGVLPASWSVLSLSKLDLSYNRALEGSLPASWYEGDAALRSLREFHVEGTGVCGSAAELHQDWPTAAITFGQQMITCDNGSPKDAKGAHENDLPKEVKYTVLLVVYIMLGMLGLLCVMCLGRRIVRRRMHPQPEPQGAAAAVPTHSDAAVQPFVASALAGPAPTIVIMPGHQMAVGYQVEVKSVEMTLASPSETAADECRGKSTVGDADLSCP